MEVGRNTKIVVESKEENMEEKFAKPAIGAIVERVINGKKHIMKMLMIQ